MPNKSMTVLAPGTRVVVAPDLVGVVTAVLIEPNYAINYRVAYMLNGNRHSDYFYDFELLATKGDREEVFIGFHTPDRQPKVPTQITDNSIQGVTND